MKVDLALRVDVFGVWLVLPDGNQTVCEPGTFMVTPHTWWWSPTTTHECVFDGPMLTVTDLATLRQWRYDTASAQLGGATVTVEDGVCCVRSWDRTLMLYAPVV